MKKGSWLAIAALILIGGFFAMRSEVGQLLLGRWSFVKSVETTTVAQANGTFYRLKVRLTYKGDAQDFDIVVGCNVREIIYKDNSSTYEVGLVPTVFGRRMSDGKGLVVRPPDACGGQTTENGRVQPDLLPVVVVYDDADTLTFGIAYLSEDAYESPLSVLKFGGATIETATRAEFDAFRGAQLNLVKRESYFSPLESDDGLKRMGFRRLTRPFGHECLGYVRFRLPDDLRPLVRQQWPRGNPVYWRSDTYEAEREITKEILDSAKIQPDRPENPARSWQAYVVPELAADEGLATRTGGGLISRSREGLFPPGIYPATDDYQAHRWPADWKEWDGFLAAKNVFVTSDLDLRGETRGFAYCSSAVLPTKEQEPAWNSIQEKPKIYRVDGQVVRSQRPAVRGGDWIFERDEYVLWPFQIYLESTRGDV